MGNEIQCEKCKTIHFGNSNKKFVYNIGGTNMEQVSEIRDLGVMIQDNLKPSLQCHKAAKCANSILGQIKRTFSYRTRDIFVKLYKMYVRPHLEYAVQVWNPWMKKDITILERVQRRATRMIVGLSGTYEDRLRAVGLTTLEQRRIRGDALQTYKLLQGIECEDQQMFTYISEVSKKYTRANENNELIIQLNHLEIRKHFFSQRSVQVWNNLNMEVKESTSVDMFKKNYDNAILSNCL